MTVSKHKMDRKLVAYDQPYEVASICRLYKIKKDALMEFVKTLAHDHSQEDVYNLLEANGYTKHPRKKK